MDHWFSAPFDVEMFAEGGLDADLDVVEIDEDSKVHAILMSQTGRSFSWFLT